MKAQTLLIRCDAPGCEAGDGFRSDSHDANLCYEQARRAGWIIRMAGDFCPAHLVEADRARKQRENAKRASRKRAKATAK